MLWGGLKIFNMTHGKENLSGLVKVLSYVVCSLCLKVNIVMSAPCYLRKLVLD